MGQTEKEMRKTILVLLESSLFDLALSHVHSGRRPQENIRSIIEEWESLGKYVEKKN